MRTVKQIEIGAIDQAMGEERRNRVLTGIESVDSAVDLLGRGRVTMLFSATPMARSVLAMEIARRIVSRESDGQSLGALVFTPGMNAEKYIQTMVMTLAGVNRWRMSRGLVPRREMVELEERIETTKRKLDALPIMIEDEWCPSPEKMVYLARAASQERELGFVVVDQLQDCSCGDLKEGCVGWGVLGSRLRRIAEEFSVPVLVLAGARRREMKTPDVLDGYGRLMEFVSEVYFMSRLQEENDEELHFKIGKNPQFEYEQVATVRFERSSFRFLDAR